LKTRLDNINREIEELASLTRQRQREIEEANTLITRYKEQQKSIRNNREFESLEKEIEYQMLEITLAEKHLKTYAQTIKVKKGAVETTETELNERQADLDVKRQELNSIESETADEVKALAAKAEVAKAKIDERLLSAYGRIRSKVRNGLAVVTVKRDACSGCFNRIPPQRQADIRLGKKLIVCEYCGRILVPGDEA
jgi:predicted  nucleic acid-binding Zn-ribbon protein